MGLFGRTLAQDWILTPLLLILIMYLAQDDQLTRILAHKDNSGTTKPPIKQNSKETAFEAPKPIKKNQILPLSHT